VTDQDTTTQAIHLSAVLATAQAKSESNQTQQTRSNIMTKKNINFMSQETIMLTVTNVAKLYYAPVGLSKKDAEERATRMISHVIITSKPKCMLMPMQQLSFLVTKFEEACCEDEHQAMLFVLRFAPLDIINEGVITQMNRHFGVRPFYQLCRNVCNARKLGNKWRSGLLNGQEFNERHAEILNDAVKRANSHYFCEIYAEVFGMNGLNLKGNELKWAQKNYVEDVTDLDDA
jgi:hypothetical protein